MDTVTLHAHFDGEQIRLDEPYELQPNAKLLITVLPRRQSTGAREGWLYVSETGLAHAHGDDEPDYPLEMIKEANPEYERR